MKRRSGLKRYSAPRRNGHWIPVSSLVAVLMLAYASPSDAYGSITPLVPAGYALLAIALGPMVRRLKLSPVSTPSPAPKARSAGGPERTRAAAAWRAAPRRHAFRPAA